MLNTLNWQDLHNISAFRKLHNFNFSGPRHFRPRILNQHPMLWPPGGLHWLSHQVAACMMLRSQILPRGEGDLRRVLVCLSRFSTAGASCHKPEPRLKIEKQTERISCGTQGFPNAVTRTWLYGSCECQHGQHIPHGIFSVHTHSNSV